MRSNTSYGRTNVVVRKLSKNVSDIEPRNRITTRLCTLSKTKLQVGKKEISGTDIKSEQEAISSQSETGQS